MGKQPTWGQIINHFNAQTESINKQNDLEDRWNQKEFSNNCDSPWPTSLVLSGYYVMWTTAALFVCFLPLLFFLLLMYKEERTEICLSILGFLLYILLFGFSCYRLGKKWQKKHFVDNSQNRGKKREELASRYEKAKYLMIVWYFLLCILTFMIILIINLCF